MLKFLERWYLAVPLLVFPLASVKKVDLVSAFHIYIYVTIGLVLIDLSLDKLVSSVRKLFNPWFLTSIVAFSTNLPELSVSLISAFKGDGLMVAPGVALGSNFVNLILGFMALFMVYLLAFFLPGVKNAVRSYDYSRGFKQLALALVLSIVASAYYPMVQGGTFYLLVWLLTILVISSNFVFLNFHSKHGKKVSLLSHIPAHTLEELARTVGNDSKIGRFLKYLIDIKENPTNFSLDDIFTSPELLALKHACEEEIRNVRSKLIKELRSELDEILELFDVYHHLDKPRTYYVIVCSLSLAFIALGSYLLDSAGDLISKNFEISKGYVSFFVLSFLTSAGEFLTSYKFFLDGKFRDGWRNIADSNLANLLIGFVVVVFILLTG